MDFLESLQNKLKCVFQITFIYKNTYLIEQENGELSIFYYLEGAQRVVGTKTKTQVIHIDEDLWKSRPKALLNRISTLFGGAERSYARQTVVARIDKKMAISFQEEHHLHGALPGKYRYGLFKNGELLAVAIFSGLRNMRHTEGYRSIELLHFCQKDCHLVVGGLSKLLAKMVQDFSPNDVMTYVDRDWSKGEKFESLGFKLSGNTAPQSFRINRITYKREIVKEADNIVIHSDEYLSKNLGNIKMVKFLP